MAGNINRHPAPNRTLGELMPGWYDVPQNPIAQSQFGVARTPTLGEIMAGAFAVPQNPIVNFGTGNVQPIGVQPGAPGRLNGQVMGVSGVGCGCGGGCGCGSGMGDVGADLSVFMTDLTSGNINQALFTDTIMGFPAWFGVAGVAALGLYLFSGTGSSRASKAYRTVRRKVTA